MSAHNSLQARFSYTAMSVMDWVNKSIVDKGKVLGTSKLTLRANEYRQNFHNSSPAKAKGQSQHTE